MHSIAMLLLALLSLSLFLALNTVCSWVYSALCTNKGGILQKPALDFSNEVQR